MAEVEAARFSCDGCGKSYKWKPEFAGKKVKCKCGFVMTAPAAPAAAEDEPDLDALYSLADEGKQAAKAGAVVMAIRCPSCKSEMEPGAGICAQCGFNLKTGSRSTAPQAAAAAIPARGGAAVATAKPSGTAGAFAAFGAPRQRGPQKQEAQDFKTTELYLPIGLLIGGVVLTVVQYMNFHPTNEPLVQALLYTGLKLAIMMGLMVVGSIFMIRFMEMAFGDPALAALKMAAIVLAPTAAASIISFLVHDAPPHGWGLVGFFIAFGFFFVLYHYLFDFDMSEMWIIVGYTTVACMILTRMIFGVMVGTSGGALMSKGAQNDDAIIQYMMDVGPMPKEAIEWVNDNSGRIVGSHPHDDSVKLIEGLREVGATEVWVAVDGPQACEVYAKMPRDAAKRKAIVDFATEWNKAHGRDAASDEGGKWFIMRFLPYNHPQPVGF